MVDIVLITLSILGIIIVGGIGAWIASSLHERKIKKRLMENPDLIEYPNDENEKEVLDGQDRRGVEEPTSSYGEPTIPRFSEGPEQVQPISDRADGSNTGEPGETEGRDKPIRRTFKPI